MNRQSVISFLMVSATLATGSVTAGTPDWDALVAEGLPSFTGSGGVVQLLETPARDPGPDRGFSSLLTIARLHHDELSTSTRGLVQAWSTRPDDLCGQQDAIGHCYGFEASWRYHPDLSLRSHDTEHFRIHYAVNETGDYLLNMNTSNPAVAVTVGQVLEEVYRVQHQDLAYLPPPTDGGRGGDDRIDVYLTELRRYGLYGYVVAESSAPLPDRPHAAAGYMVLDNDFLYYGYADPLSPLQVTAAHEYFHVVQNGHSWRVDPAFMEQTATWMEDIVYPQVHDNYAYIGEPFVDQNGDGQYSADPDGDGDESDAEPVLVDHIHNNRRDRGSQDWPELPLDAYNDVPLIQYGRFLWVRFLQERFGADLIRETWWRTAGTTKSVYTVLDDVLAGYDSSLARAVHEYALWAYDKERFSDGYNYPLVWVDRTTQLPGVYLKTMDSAGLARLQDHGRIPQLHLSSVYQQLYHPQGQYQFRASHAGVAMTMLVDYGDGSLVEQEVVLGSRTGVWQAPPGVVRAIAVITNTDARLDGLRWELVSADRVPVSVQKNDSADQLAATVGRGALAWELAVLLLCLAGGCRRRRFT